MRNLIIKSFTAIAFTASLASCSDKWLETDIFSGVDSETALNNPTAVGYALNGTYYQLQRYYFAGDYAFIFGDILSDIIYWNADNNHFNTIYQTNYQPTDTYLYYIWDYGYKVVDNSARVVKAAKELLPDATGSEAAELGVYEAEARCLRAYANLIMVNVFGHQIKVNGSDYSSQPGLVIVDEPIEAYAEVERSSVGETYSFILNDLNEALALFRQYGDRGEMCYFNEAAAYALLARANLYMENWSAAASAASSALSTAGISALTYTASGYKALYAGQYTNNECFVSLAIDNTTNWSANSLGTLFTTYGWSTSPYLRTLYQANDVRLSLIDLWDFSKGNEYESNWYGGKFFYNQGNAAYANCFLLCAPEMYLIMAEAYNNLNQISQAQDALLVVAKRNPAITSVANLPGSTTSIMDFIYEERARELYQDGLRLWDLRRWNIPCNLYAHDAPNLSWYITDAKVGNLVFPIPQDEINADFGVTQNEDWSSSKPTINN